MSASTESLDAWIDRQYPVAIAGMQRSISPVHIVKQRPFFGQTIRPRRGAVVASPVLASYDPDPDYFFHWFRDSALVIDALRLLYEDGAAGTDALTQLADFVAFGLSLESLDGAPLVEAPAWRDAVAADHVRFLRDPAELAAVRGRVAAESRVNPDGSLDISRWNRPQYDGPPLTALTLLRWARHVPDTAETGAPLAALIRAQLAFTFANARQSSYDIWEEEFGLHYYNLRVSAAALRMGADWLQAQDHERAQAYRDEAVAIERELDGFWLPERGHYRSRVLASGERSSKELDIAVILAAIHAEGGAAGGAHGPADPRLHASLTQLERHFEGEYPINHGRPPGLGPALGRYPRDVYYAGGAYYFSTLGAAEFCFRAAAAGADRQRFQQRGDAYLATVRRYTPASGELSEQFDQRSGEPCSARHLAWSYAAFISCTAARRAALAAG